MLAFACQGLPFWHQKSIQKSCCFMSPCRTSVVRFYDDFMRKLDLGPLQNQAGAKIAFKIFKSPQCCQQVHGFFQMWRVLFATCFFTALLGNPLAHFGSMSVLIWFPFFINSGIHLILFRFPLTANKQSSKRHVPKWGAAVSRPMASSTIDLGSAA